MSACCTQLGAIVWANQSQPEMDQTDPVEAGLKQDSYALINLKIAEDVDSCTMPHSWLHVVIHHLHCKKMNLNN